MWRPLSGAQGYKRRIDRGYKSARAAGLGIRGVGRWAVLFWWARGAAARVWPRRNEMELEGRQGAAWWSDALTG